MAVTGWLIDKSALVRIGESKSVTKWAERIQSGLVHMSTITRLEVAYSARSAIELEKSFSMPPLTHLRIEPLSSAIEERAWEVIRQLAKRGQHRAPSIPDLLIAATAEKCDLVLLHVDKDFELIAKFTKQRIERLS